MWRRLARPFIAARCKTARIAARKATKAAASRLGVPAPTSLRLAPVYDLVCTRAWPALSKHLAFRVGDAVDAGAMGPNAWRKFAGEVQISPKLVLDAAASVSTRVLEQAADVAQRLIDEGADPRALRRACEVVLEHARRSARLTEIEGKPEKKKKEASQEQ